MKETKFEVLQDIKQSLTASDFMETLNFYNMTIKKNSILCPFHNDKHFGSCMISKNKQFAKCYACGESFDAIKLVREKENMNYVNAVEFLWTTILGRTMPQVDEKEKNKRILSYNELKFIGLLHSSGKRIVVPSNAIIRFELCPEDFSYYDTDYDECDRLTIGHYVKMPSVYELYNTDRQAAICLLKGKTEETLQYYKEQKKKIIDSNTPLGKIFNENEIIKKEVIEEVEKNILYAKSIVSKLRKHDIST